MITDCAAYRSGKRVPGTLELEKAFAACASALLSSTLDANSAQVAMRQAKLALEQTHIATRQNADMRKISAWVAIVAVPTMIAGVYGMNFDFMPGLSWPFAFPVALAVMAGLCFMFYKLFRRSGWL